jgi:uncharacterized protein (DUF1697 family)
VAAPTRHVAFLGGINVGGHRVTMDRLRQEVAALGFADVDTFIASGNVVFTAPPTSTHADVLADGLAAALGWPVPTFVRTARALLRAVDVEPFGPAEDGFTHMILFCRSAPSTTIEDASSEREQFEVHGTEVHWRIRGGVSDSEITLPKLAKLLGQPCTSRNVKSLRILADRLRSER